MEVSTKVSKEGLRGQEMSFRARILPYRQPLDRNVGSCEGES
jgi:hypothetical protein